MKSFYFAGAFFYIKVWNGQFDFLKIFLRGKVFRRSAWAAESEVFVIEKINSRYFYKVKLRAFFGFFCVICR